MKQTAVEWLLNSLDYNQNMLGIKEIIDQAKVMEKEQIINAYEDGKENQRESITNIYKYIIGEYYYNQTYNK